MDYRGEKQGVTYGLLAAALWSLWPVFVHHSAAGFSPLFFVATATGIGGVTAFIYALVTGKLLELKRSEAYFSLVIVTLCVIVIPQALLAVGSRMTSGVNTSVLLLAEVIYTLVFTHFIGERTTLLKVMSGLLVFLGAALIIYKGNLSINPGDLVILAVPLLYPIGNLYSKRALNYISGTTITLVRFLLGSVLLFLLSFLFEQQKYQSPVHWEQLSTLLFAGVLVLGVGRIIAYESLHRLDISKFLSIAMTFPLFSLIVLVGIYREPISTLQVVGTIVMMCGVYLSIKRTSVDPKLTKYSGVPG